ncbi:MAG: ATP-grasp domain-containing protein [Planctomyces sp.]|nr:ATP-grasp domain-containing protein [Planctomyces sp.]
MWIIEDRVFPREEELLLRDVLVDLGVDFRIVSDVELRSNTIAISADNVPRGSCWWISQLASEANWPGETWGTIADFSFAHYSHRFSGLMLNYPFEKLSFHELCWRGVEGPSNSSLFVRPDDGFKSFEGQVVRSTGFADWVKRMQLLQVRGSMPVIVAPLKVIKYEWRLIIVDGTVVAGSLFSRRFVNP